MQAFEVAERCCDEDRLYRTKARRAAGVSRRDSGWPMSKLVVPICTYIAYVTQLAVSSNHAIRASSLRRVPYTVYANNGATGKPHFDTFAEMVVTAKSTKAVFISFHIGWPSTHSMSHAAISFSFI